MNSRDVHKNFEKQMVAVSLYFRELRFAENLSQSQVATETGLHYNTISNIENSKNYNIQTFLLLCEFFEISATELFSIIDEA